MAALSLLSETMMSPLGVRPCVSFFAALLLGVALPGCGGGAASAVASAAVDKATSGLPATTPTGLHRRLIVGYQGWFGCPGDADGNNAWQHWFTGEPGVGTMSFDALPSLRGLDPKDLCDTGIARAGGGTVGLFSAQSPGVVQSHFAWMKEHGIDGAAVQRFVVELADASKRRRTDRVLANARAAAEASGRVFYLSYDVSGADPATVVAAIRQDWRRLDVDLQLTNSPAYLRDGGKPVLQLWGFGFADRPGEPAEVAALIADLKSGGAGLAAVRLIGGVPSDWRTLGGDAKPAPAWAAVYRSYDVISPWSVGRFGDDAGADAYVNSVVGPDLVETRRLGLGYQPVVFPGFSWRNLMAQRSQPGQLNAIPRRCGNFMWRQVWNLLNAGSDSLYAAMFDEVDEGTALFRVEPLADQLPVGAQMISLNQDGCALPDDWYLRVTGQAAGYLRSGLLPPSALSDVIRP